MSMIATCECVICKHRQEIDLDNDKVDELGPSCARCFGPMVVQNAAYRAPKTRARRRGLGVSASGEPRG